MSTVNMLQAKTNLSKLVEAVESGAEEEIIIARNGKPVARLMPLAAKAKIRLGLAEGKYDVSAFDDWDTTAAAASNNWLEESIARDERMTAAAQARLIASKEAGVDDDAPAA